MISDIPSFARDGVHFFYPGLMVRVVDISSPRWWMAVFWVAMQYGLAGRYWSFG